MKDLDQAASDGNNGLSLASNSDEGRSEHPTTPYNFYSSSDGCDVWIYGFICSGAGIGGSDDFSQDVVRGATERDTY